MNLFNRIVIILLILAAMILIPLALMFPEQAQFALRNTADIIQANIDWLNTLTPGAQIGVRLLLSAMGMVAFIIGLLFLVLEVIRIRRTTVRLKDGSGELMMNGVAGHLTYYVDLLPDILRVKPTVRSTGKSVHVALYVETAPGINVPEKSREIRETAQRVLEDQLGLQVKREIKVMIKPVPYPKTSRDKHRPLVTAPAAPPLFPKAADTVEPLEQSTVDEDTPSTAKDSEVIEVKAPLAPDSQNESLQDN
jgi:hypothetical protein